jgi:hypothetical protein
MAEERGTELESPQPLAGTRRVFASFLKALETELADRLHLIKIVHGGGRALVAELDCRR